MVKTLTIQTDIQPDRMLQIPLPADVPVGLAEVVIVIAPTQLTQTEPGNTAADMAASPLFGLWADRTDLGDSRNYARRLREQAERRKNA